MIMESEIVDAINYLSFVIAITGASIVTAILARRR